MKRLRYLQLGLKAAYAAEGVVSPYSQCPVPDLPRSRKHLSESAFALGVPLADTYRITMKQCTPRRRSPAFSFSRRIGIAYAHMKASPNVALEA